MPSAIARDRKLLLIVSFLLMSLGVRAQTFADTLGLSVAQWQVAEGPQFISVVAVNPRHHRAGIGISPNTGFPKDHVRCCRSLNINKSYLLWISCRIRRKYLYLQQKLRI